jgi:hypothetical protein
MIRFPDERLSVITLCNRGDANPTGIAMQVAELYLADRMKPAEPELAGAAAATAAPSATVDAARYAGLFWDPVTGTVRRIVARDGKLFYERRPGNETELAPLGGDRFALTGGPAEVLFPPGEMHVLVPGDKPAVFQKVEPFAPAPAELAAYAGTFYSEELDMTFKLSVEGGRLVLRTRRQHETVPLDPIFADAFRFPGGGPLLRFTRTGKDVTGFSMGNTRARNLGFTRTGS